MTTMTRRSVLTLASGLAAAAALGLPKARAQSATPAAAPVPAGLAGYPELTVTITDAAYVVSADSVPAGLVLLTVINASSNPTSAGLIGPEQGSTMADLLALVATPTTEGELPAFIYHAAVLGGPAELDPGKSGLALLTVPAGDWAVFGEGDQPPVFLTAVEGGGVTAEPKADVEVVLGDFSFNGIDALKAGDSLWKVTNKGAQPHMMSITGLPDGTTEDQLMAAMMVGDNETPPAGVLSEDQVTSTSNGVLMLSSMRTMWTPVTFAKGTYAALCWVTDSATGQPHAMEGMMKIFVVS